MSSNKPGLLAKASSSTMGARRNKAVKSRAGGEIRPAKKVKSRSEPPVKISFCSRRSTHDFDFFDSEPDILKVNSRLSVQTVSHSNNQDDDDCDTDDDQILLAIKTTAKDLKIGLAAALAKEAKEKHQSSLARKDERDVDRATSPISEFSNRQGASNDEGRGDLSGSMQNRIKKTEDSNRTSDDRSTALEKDQTSTERLEEKADSTKKITRDEKPPQPENKRIRSIETKKVESFKLNRANTERMFRMQMEQEKMKKLLIARLMKGTKGGPLPDYPFRALNTLG